MSHEQRYANSEQNIWKQRKLIYYEKVRSIMEWKVTLIIEIDLHLIHLINLNNGGENTNFSIQWGKSYNKIHHALVIKITSGMYK